MAAPPVWDLVVQVSAPLTVMLLLGIFREFHNFRQKVEQNHRTLFGDDVDGRSGIVDITLDNQKQIEDIQDHL